MKFLLGALIFLLALTGCGGRTAEAEPTQALVPTFTPAPPTQPPATATITPRALYLGLVSRAGDELVAGMGALGKLAGDAKPDDADWVAAVKDAIRQVTFAYELIQVAKPTADLEAMHAQLLDAAKSCDMAATTFGMGIDGKDEALLRAGLGMLGDCGTKFAAIEVPMTE